MFGRNITFTTLGVAAMVLTAACKPVDPPAPVVTPLAAPHLSVAGSSVEWSEVEGATGYVVDVSGTLSDTLHTTSLNVASFAGIGTHEVRAKATGDADNDSAWSASVSVTVEKYASLGSLPSDFSAIRNHPRLMLQRGQEQNIRQMLSESGNGWLVTLHNYIMTYADQLQTTSVLGFPAQQGLLKYSREALKRIFYLSYAYRMTGTESYASRAEKELLAISAFPNWNPSHYLDVAEMSLAAAIGYDWLYDYLSASSKNAIADAIYNKSLAVSVGASYHTGDNNWNNVCTTGTLCGALAIYESYPTTCASIIPTEISGSLSGIEVYGPDGGYPEGYTYWGYGTSFSVIGIESVRTSLGIDCQTQNSVGFKESALYRQFMTTPTHSVFAYGDAAPEQIICATSLWFAKENGDKSLIYPTKMLVENGMMNFQGEERILPFLLVMASKGDVTNITAPAEHFWHSRGRMPLFVYRQGWSDEGDAYLGVKAGVAAYSHAHMDSGSFIYEKNGVRWAVELGGQSYGAVENMLYDYSQNGLRWQLFRYGRMSHNTLWFDDMNHIYNALSSIDTVYRASDRKGCTVNLNRTFEGEVAGARRTVWLDAQNNLHVKDYITTGAASTTYTWNMVTEAKPIVDAVDALMLSQNNQRMRLRCVKPDTAIPFIKSATTGNSYDESNTGKTRVGFTAPLSANRDYEIEVTLQTVE